MHKQMYHKTAIVEFIGKEPAGQGQLKERERKRKIVLFVQT